MRGSVCYRTGRTKPPYYEAIQISVAFRGKEDKTVCIAARV
jgi:hypothetical protein